MVVNACRVFGNLYRDSVSLMQLSAALSRRPGVEQAAAIMATEANLALLAETGLLPESHDAAVHDVLVVLAGEAASVAAALDEAEMALLAPPPIFEDEASAAPVPRSLAMALAENIDANLALISTPGDYAAAEALKALGLGLNVMLFSDNVALADEIALKARARADGLMVMGPDCGTAIIDGVPLGFANAVGRGDIGLIAASGTGLQQVCCLIDRAGGGVSQAVGTGGRDMSAEVGAVTTLQAMERLAADPETTVIVLVSKPPAPEVAERVLAQAAKAGKPVVVNFLGADASAIERPNVHAAATLEDAALAALALARGEAPEAADGPAPAQGIRPGRKQKYLRGLYSGGTLCYEALAVLGDSIGPVHSSTPLAGNLALADPWRSEGHTVLDLGTDQFTRGRPHPMIDQRLRSKRMVREARDPETAVILFDLVLGYGAHPDPAPEIAAAVAEARAAAGHNIAFVASVCGTEADPQRLSRQEAALEEAGVLLSPSNARAVRRAAAILA